MFPAISGKLLFQAYSAHGIHIPSKLDLLQGTQVFSTGVNPPTVNSSIIPARRYGRSNFDFRVFTLTRSPILLTNRNSFRIGSSHGIHLFRVFSPPIFIPFGISSHILGGKTTFAVTTCISEFQSIGGRVEDSLQAISDFHNPPKVSAPFCSTALRPKHTGLLDSPHHPLSITAQQE